MLELKRILFPTDFSRCAEQALTHALYLAKQFQAHLHVLHAIVLQGYPENKPEFGFVHIDSIHRRMQEAAESQMRAMLEAHPIGLITTSMVQQRGISAAPVILQYASEHDVELIVMGTHGRRGLGHLFLGSVAEEVVRRAGCPVLTIRERGEPQPIEELNHILVPVDFSEHSREALRYARQIAALYDSGLQLLHVIEETLYPSFYVLKRSPSPDRSVELRQRAERELQRLFEETPGPFATACFRVIEGRASTDIVEFAKTQASDLIVIASHGLSGIERLLMGSITEKVVRRAPCPVLTVRTFRKAADDEGQMKYNRIRSTVPPRADNG